MYRPKRKAQKHTALSKLFSEVMYPIALISPFFTIPQVLQVWVHHQVSGVSLTTWGGYTLGSLFWFIYGLVHGEKPLIIMQFLLIIMQGSVFLGILILK